ncbi:olfactory receptor 13C8-like [Hypomesus transpacificus]|uniref:olfactory receptor 13C8-like n=1 Tax=Hypomesus transpacificus TaxID=137520 RepID=UPI001F0840FA|nr:olfactory receptor 13C8-like [Hypomesus transpacificus]
MEFNNKSTFVVQEIIITGLDGVPYPKLVGAAILFVLLFILLGSFTNIAIIVFNRPLHSPMYFLICTLAMVDIIYTSSMIYAVLKMPSTIDRKKTFNTCISHIIVVACFFFSKMAWVVYHAPKLVGSAIILVLLLIQFGSFTNIAIIVFNRPLHSPMYFLICALAMVDIIYTSSMSSTMLNVLLGEERRVQFSLCILKHFMFHLGTHIEPLTITLMAFDRLIAISYPLRYHTILSNRNMFVLIVGIWTGGLLRTACVDPIVYASSLQDFFFCTCISHIIVLACFFFKKMVHSMSQIRTLGLSLTVTHRNGLSIVLLLDTHL